MGVRTAIADRVIRAAKAFGGNEPPEMAQAAHGVSQMTGPPFAPGEPIGPYDGYSRTPRSRDFGTGYNIATRPRTHERVSFDTLTGLVEAYDVAQICIWHRIDSLRSLDWKLIAADGYSGDVADAITIGMAALEKPDRENSFEAWLAKWLYGVLAYDAAPLARMRNRAGRCVGLQVVDGTTIAPLLDYWGNSPKRVSPDDPEPEAYVQYANGLPWNWLTRSDLIYEPFRPVPRSIYGRAPLESIILNANTDIRFQVYFLQRFTSGNIPEAFASAPESWTPDQVEAFQGYWDSFMYGDQAQKSQIKWIPAGSSFTWSNEKEFTDQFSLFLMRKTAAAYHVVPTDLGFTETSNYSSGESQGDVGHRVGDLPLIRYAQRIVTSFLRDDLGLPLKHTFDLGEEQDDRLAQAQSDDIYIKNGTIGVSEAREMRFGLPEPAGQTVPRFVFTSRAGPIPLNSLYGVAGPVDPQTAAPAEGADLPHMAFEPPEGVLPNPPLINEPLAEQEFGPSAIPPAPPPQPGAVSKEATAGITSETGITGHDLIGDDEEDGQQVSGPGHFITEDEARTAAREQVAKAELAAFRRYSRARIAKGQWRDFKFRALDAKLGHRLNDAGRFAVRKAAGEVAVAGLAVLAADTGRVLMIQRALCDDDPAAGKIEFPGGHIEADESPLQAAWREWAEETGAVPPPGVQTGTWLAGDGIYRGIVWTAESEASVPVRGETVVPNPDADPDGDGAEAILWVAPADLAGNPAVRAELLASLDGVLAALGCSPGCCGAECCQDGGCCGGSGGCGCGPSQGDESVCPCGTPAVYDELNGWQHADGSVSHDGDDESVSDKMAAIAKAVVSGPKAPGRDWPGWELDGPAVAHWTGQAQQAVSATLTPAVLHRAALAYLAEHPNQDGTAPGKQDRNDAAYDWLAGWLAAAGVALALGPITAGIITDGYLIGAVSGHALATGTTVDTGTWTPGDLQAAQDRIDALGAGGPFGAMLALASDAAATAIAAAVLAALARVLAAADGTASAEAVAADLATATADPVERAVGHQVTTASAQAARDRYEALGVTEVMWVTDPGSKSGVCPACLANEAASPQLLGEPWPSGECPVHDGCRCAECPVRFAGD